MTSGWHWLGLFAAGGCGVCLRFVLALRIDRWAAEALPYAGTLAVNLIGCLAIGVLAPLVPQGPARAIAVAGLLGGFTTYSTFALLTVELAGEARWAPLAWQLGLHVGGGALMVALGSRVGRLLAGA
ncbi:fluoride efflux transporter FluC [Nannocystis punicea]|uniref:Fluoride-specific ion channel FluC n=1 Tax=Nannocystis punicea TaxID=2995304 RepID=A0ABY7H9J1_9BACT|nr:CrcB family protein [Nannocystis poenicansa]WAS95939.1 CrcB family protein [Nannocystis poenicansa]